jgi:uncharacterized membrane protein
MGFFAIIIVPVVRKMGSPEERRAILQAAGTRFAKVGNAALVILVVTGLGNLHFRGLFPSFASSEFWRTPFGATLAAKLVVVALVIGVSLFHGRDARRAATAGTRPSGIAALLGRATLVLSVIAVVLGVFLVRGLP